ncbi:MAG TPA: VOC family protein [Kofleriaceae bacterium]|nr:VOC family protein [Kofleriaceae bacterium]
MIDHLSLLVTDFERSLRFYLEALAPLGYEIMIDLKREQIPDLPAPRICGLGAGKPDVWLSPCQGKPTNVHLAFTAVDRAQVDAFYEAAIRAGGVDNGKPGPRPQYHPGYYGAFVLDPDGHNIEACCHTPP